MNQIFEGAFLIDGVKIEFRPSSILNRKKTPWIGQKTMTKRWASAARPAPMKSLKPTEVLRANTIRI